MEGQCIEIRSFLESEIVLVRWLNGNKIKKQLRLKARFKRRTLHVPGQSIPNAIELEQYIFLISIEFRTCDWELATFEPGL